MTAVFTYNYTKKKIHDVEPREIKFLRDDRYRILPGDLLAIRADVLRSRLITFPNVCEEYLRYSTAYRSLEEMQLTSLLCHLSKGPRIDEDAPWVPHKARYARANEFVRVSDKYEWNQDQLILFSCGNWFAGQATQFQSFIHWQATPNDYRKLTRLGGYSVEYCREVDQLMHYLREKFPAKELVLCLTEYHKFVVLCDVANNYWNKVVVPYITSMDSGLNLHWATRSNPNTPPKNGRKDVVILLSWRAYLDDRVRECISWNQLLRKARRNDKN